MALWGFEPSTICPILSGQDLTSLGRTKKEDSTDIHNYQMNMKENPR